MSEPNHTQGVGTARLSGTMETALSKRRRVPDFSRRVARKVYAPYANPTGASDEAQGIIKCRTQTEASCAGHAKCKWDTNGCVTQNAEAMRIARLANKPADSFIVSSPEPVPKTKAIDRALEFNRRMRQARRSHAGGTIDNQAPFAKPTLAATTLAAVPPQRHRVAPAPVEG